MASSTTIEQDNIVRLIQGILKRLKALETQVLLNKKQISSEPSWVAPTYANSWVNFGGSNEVGGYGLDQRNFVLLKGLIKSGSIGSKAFTLPTGYRPTNIRIFATVSNGLFGVVEVRANGDVVPTVGNNTYVSLEGITFYAEA